MSASVDIRDNVTLALKALPNALSSQRLDPQIGAAEKLLFVKHFLGLPQNKQGFPSSGFWSGAARATNWSLTVDGVLISVNQIGVRQRIEGGDIKPTGNKQFLTIPATAEAYGHRAGEFDHLRFAVINGRPALVEALATAVKFGRVKKDGTRTVTHGLSTTGLVPFYYLVRMVHQEPNPAVLPTEEEITRAAVATIQSAVKRNQSGGVA